MTDHSRIFLVLGALSAIASIVLGTVAAHVPNETLIASMPWFQTAMQYHQFHALALLIVGLLVARSPSRWFVAAGWLMVIGTVLFSGTLYLRTLAGIHDFHAVTPYGGGAYLLAWAMLAIGALTRGGR
jgi:uncharacterized membrane protein YgdD (TMEM256/DUF423 family)